MIKSKKLLAIGVIAALGLAACGSDDDASSSTDAPEGTEAPEATDAPDSTDAMAEGDCAVGVVYDITGRELLYEKRGPLNVTRCTLDLDRCIFHVDFNRQKLDALLAAHGDDVEVECELSREAWFVLRARRPGVSARASAAEAGLEELRAYKRRSRQSIDRMRQAQQT